jgi:xylulokinase
MIADMFGKRVAILENQEGSAYGAALLAMVGTGEYSSLQEVTRATIREVRVCEPRVEEGEIYNAGYQVYRSLYPAMKGALR